MLSSPFLSSDVGMNRIHWKELDVKTEVSTGKCHHFLWNDKMKQIF
jgi:hypothetical protein